MTLLSRDQILAAQDLRTEDVPVPEWQPGGFVRVRSLSGRERDQYQESIVRIKGSDMQIIQRDLRVKLIVRAAVDETGRLLFSESDVAALAEKNAGALERVFNAAQRLSGLSQADIEEMTKNSANGQNEDSGSA